MGAKVKKLRGNWTLVVHDQGRRKHHKVGPTDADRRDAEKAAREINARMTLGAFELPNPTVDALPCDRELNRWLDLRSPSLKPTTRKLNAGLIANHLIPHFGSKDLREIRESHVRHCANVLQQKGLAPQTIRNALGVLRAVFNSLVEEDRLGKNPAANIGRLARALGNATAKETQERTAWSHHEASILITVAKEHEARFAPVLELLFMTGLRRGEALGLQWAEIDFDGRRLTVRRSITSQGTSTPKSGKSRRVVMTENLAERLFDLLGERRAEGIRKGWPEIPSWVFCSETGTAPDPRNSERVWGRVRRRAQNQGVRPLPLHSTRHSWATWALQAGKNIRWVAEQLGHSDPSTTLKHYAHAMQEDDEDLSFLVLEDGSGRHNTAPGAELTDLDSAKWLDSMARREGFEPPTLRFEESPKGRSKRRRRL